MPLLLDPNVTGTSRELLSRDIHYTYAYPSLTDGTRLDLAPNSELSKKICIEVTRRAQVSSERVRSRDKTWQELDDVRNVYIQLSDVETIAQQKDSRRPVPIVIPAMAASIETILTYILSAIGTPPAFKYIGSGPEDTVGALLLERYIEWQFNRYKHILALITQWRDSLIYGFGVAVPMWCVKYGSVKQTAPNNIVDLGSGTMLQGEPITRTARGIISEGHELQAVDPRNFLWDPNVCEYNVQKGEFVGFINRSNLVTILNWEQNAAGAVVNAKYLKHISCVSSLTSDSTNIRTGESASTTQNLDITKPVDIIHMWINLIPKDWGLSSYEYPQKWYFAVAGDSVVLAAAPLEYKHDLFPVVVCAPDFDGHSALSISRAEFIYPMQHHLNWFINSLVEGSLKDLGGTTVYDPSCVYEPDLLKKGPVKLVRLRKPMWGKDARQAIFPVPSTNNAASHNLIEADYLLNMMQRICGANDAMQGMQRVGGERVTALEIAKVQSGAMGRMQMIARIIGAQSMQDLAYLLASQSQQKMTKEFYAQITGRGEEYLRAEYGVDQYVQVTPDLIDVNIDIVPIDGSIATGDNPAGWAELSKTLIANPVVMNELYQRWDVTRVFKHAMKEMGLKNTEDFERRTPPPQGPAMQAQVMADEEVMRQKQAGNLIPMKGLGNAAT